jgi:hypothetical protein
VNASGTINAVATGQVKSKSGTFLIAFTQSPGLLRNRIGYNLQTDYGSVKEMTFPLVVQFPGHPLRCARNYDKLYHVAAFTSFARATSKATNKAALLLFSVAVLLAGGAAAVRGQSALDGFDPNANGQIYAVVVQPDGKILIGGDFTTLSPNGGAAVTRNRIARLNPDGTLDTAFNPNANSSVYSIAVQADGKILAGGAYN